MELHTANPLEYHTLLSGSGKWHMAATSPQNHLSFKELFKRVNMVPFALFGHLDLCS
jgi:hypothetical protein